MVTTDVSCDAGVFTDVDCDGVNILHTKALLSRRFGVQNNKA